MLKLLDRWRKAGPYILFLALILFSLRDVLVLSGVIGHNWDWEISAFPEQIWGRLTREFFAWDYQLRGGYYSPFRTAGLYSLFALAFSVFGGEFFSRAFIVIPMFLSAICMRRLAAEVLGLSAWWSAVAGILYMLSPVAYSRIMAGHSFMLAYALFPLLYVYLIRTVEAHTANRFPLRDAIVAGLLLGLMAMHASMMVLSFIVLAVVLLFAFIRSSRRIRLVLVSTVILAIFALLNAYWALPVGIGYATSGTLFHSGSAVHNPADVTASTVVTQRENLFFQSMQLLSESLRMDSVPGYTTEFAYPVPGMLATPWLLISFLLPITAYSVLLGLRNQKDSILILVISGLAGTTLVSGAASSLGAFIARWLMLHAFPVWAEFGNTGRAMPLVALALCALVPLSLQQLSERIGAAKRVTVISTMVLAIYVSPFLAGSTMIDSKEPLALRSYQPSAGDQQLYDFLRQDRDSFRITYMTPPWMYYPELYDLGYEWMGGLSPHPEFFVPYFNPDAWRIASSFRTDVPESLSGKLLGLAAVKYLVYPRARFVNPSLGIYPPSIQPLQVSPSRPALVDQILETQNNLVPVSLPISSTILLRNNSYLPRVYAASQATLVQGDSDQLASIADSAFFAGKPALFFREQQDTATLPRLTAQADRLLNTRSGAVDDRQPESENKSAYLLSFTPLGHSVQTFTLARQDTLSVRVQSSRFQLAPARAEDLSSGTFAAVEPDQATIASGNILYDESLAPDGNSLQVTALLPAAWSNSQYVEQHLAIDPVNLVDFPTLHISSQVDNPSIQAVAVQLELDTDGDVSPDAVWTSPLFTHGKFKTDDLDTLQSVRQEFPGKARYDVVGVRLHFQRNPQQEWDRTTYPAGLYTYQIQELGLYDKASKAGWSWHAPATLAPEQVVTITRSLGALDPSRFSLQVEYQAEGPATLYVDARLVASNQKGAEKVIPIVSQIVGSFSEGILTLDARDQLATPIENERWTASRVELIARRLRAGRELRPTTIRLLRVGSRWMPSAAGPNKQEPPVLTIDDRPIALKEIPPDADHLAYSSEPLVLSPGEHRVAALYSAPDSPYIVQAIELSPVAGSVPSKAPNISFESVNPTRFRVHVADAQSPYFLVFSETFHPGWRAYILPPTGTQAGPLDSHRWYEQSALLSYFFDSGASEIPDHYLANGFANSWFVPQTGNYDIVIEFAPQRTFEGGWVVSLVTLAGSVLFLVLRRK